MVKKHPLKLVAFILNLLGTIATAICIIPLFWRIPMTKRIKRAYDMRQKLPVKFKVLNLIFCDPLAGILLLVDKEEPEALMCEKAGASMKGRRAIGNAIGHILLVIISVVWIAPFILLFLQSFRMETTGVVGYIFPRQWGLGNYLYLFNPETGFLKWYFNTFIIALVVCILQTVMQFMMSYALSRFRFKLRKPLMNTMLVIGMFPGFLTMIILYTILKQLGLTNDNAVPGLILVYVASSGMGYYVSKGFLDTLPKSLDEAALVDGATRMQIFFKVILPLCKPILIYTILTSFMGPWGDFVFAKIIVKDSEVGMNVAMGLQSWLGNQIASHFTHFCAGGVVVAIPVMVLFMFLQKYYVEGVTGGAVKG